MVFILFTTVTRKLRVNWPLSSDNDTIYTGYILFTLFLIYFALVFIILQECGSSRICCRSSMRQNSSTPYSNFYAVSDSEIFCLDAFQFQAWFFVCLFVCCGSSLLLLLLHSPAMSLGFTILGEIRDRVNRQLPVNYRFWNRNTYKNLRGW